MMVVGAMMPLFLHVSALALAESPLTHFPGQARRTLKSGGRKSTVPDCNTEGSHVVNRIREVVKTARRYSVKVNTELRM